MKKRPNYPIPVEQFINNSRDFQQGSEEAAILFAELVGSAEYKRDHPALQGLVKTVAHNGVARKAILSHQGQVVRYLGDGVMGLFQGPDARASALRAGLAAISGMNDANKERGWEFPHAASTRVGFHFGKIWMFEYDESTVPDPQGSTVDIAARLAGIGAPNQLVCTEEDFKKAGAVDCCAPMTVKRFVKGVTQALELRVIVPVGEHCDPNHLPDIPAALPREVTQGIRLVRDGRSKEALDTFNNYLKSHPDNFHANLYAGFLLLQKASDLKGVEETQSYLCAAKWARPQSSRVWLLLSWLRFKQFELSHDLESLDHAIRYAEIAVACAEDSINSEAGIESKTYWARYLFKRSKLKPAMAQHDLAQAGLTCAELDTIIESALPQHRLEYYVTHALVLIASGQEEKAVRMIEKAKAMNSQFAGVLEAQYELAMRNAERSQGPTFGG